jgi:hypothetical protein
VLELGERVGHEAARRGGALLMVLFKSDRPNKAWAYLHKYLSHVYNKPVSNFHLSLANPNALDAD